MTEDRRPRTERQQAPGDGKPECRIPFFGLRSPDLGACVSFLGCCFIAVICSIVLSGCAYYSTTSSYLPSHIQTIAIPMFENRSFEYGVSEKLTDTVIDKFMANSRLKVVGKKAADSVLEAMVVEVKDEPFTISENEMAKQYRLSIIIAVAYRDVKTNELIWENSALEGWETYEVSGPTDRNTALDKAIEKLATDIVNQTLAGW